MSRKKRWLLLYVPAAIIAIALFLYSQNNWIGVTHYKLASGKLPGGFDSYRIVQLSDLHNKTFGKEQRTLLRKVAKLEPDIIVMTGDLVDSNRYDEVPALQLMSAATAIAPVYYVTGNHEFASGQYDTLERLLTEAGVHMLRNERTTIALGDGFFTLAGVDDPLFDRGSYCDAEQIASKLSQALQDNIHSDSYLVLLSHRPELFETYAAYGADLSLTGHAHGGQFRIPWVGGVIAPGQGFWPQYSEGLHTIGASSMIVNRGLGNSVVPQRVFNRPEIVVVDFQHSEE